MSADNHRILQASEVAWYFKHGRYPELRIVRDGHGQQYVIGDWSWNRMAVPREIIEDSMSDACRRTRYNEIVIADKHWEMYRMRQEGKTLQEIGDAFDLSRERIRQLLHRVETAKFWHKEQQK